MNARSKFAAKLVLTVGLIASTSSIAFAQSAEPAADEGGLSDIIVTATRRATNVQDVPLAISAIGGDALRDRGIVDPSQLSSLAPNLNVDQGMSNGSTHVSIRGLASTDFGLGASSPVAIYVDDVYQPFQFGLGTQAYDLNRVEVLRGPQGTLFGKNTTGGALNYYAQTPTKRNEGYLSFDVGSGDFGRYAVEGAFNRVLSDDVAARLSFRVTRRDDYVTNLFDGDTLGHYNNYNARLQFAWTPSEDTTVNLKLFGLKQKGDGPVYIAKGDPAFGFGLDSRSTNSDIATFENFENYGATLKVDQSFGDYTLTSISGIQQGKYRLATNDDGVGFDIFHSRQFSDTWQASQELRLATPVSAPLRAVVGLFGQFDEINAMQGSANTGPLPEGQYVSTSPARQKTTTMAAFGSVTWDVTDQFSLIGGLRYSYERKKIEVPFAMFTNRAGGDLLAGAPVLPFRSFTDADINFYTLLANHAFRPATDFLENGATANRDDHTWKKLTWDITANFKPTEDSLLYAKVATGFRSGGYPVGTTAPGAFVRLSPETVTSYEVGFKSEWLNRKLRVNGSAFLMDYQDMQVQTPRTDGFSGLVLSNAGSARVQGVELEIEAAPVTGLVLSGSVGFNDAKYRNFGPQTGNVLPYAPRWTGNASASYEFAAGEDSTVRLGTDWTYRSRIHFDPYQFDITSDRERFVGNARISFGDAQDAWRVAAYVNNLTDQDMAVFAFALDVASGFAPTIYAPRRTYGGQVSFRF